MSEDVTPTDPQPEPAAPVSPDAAIRSLGFDPDLVQAVVLTPTSAVAVSSDYPEPYIAPEA